MIGKTHTQCHLDTQFSRITIHVTGEDNNLFDADDCDSCILTKLYHPSRAKRCKRQNTHVRLTGKGSDFQNKHPREGADTPTEGTNTMMNLVTLSISSWFVSATAKKRSGRDSYGSMTCRSKLRVFSTLGFIVSETIYSSLFPRIKSIRLTVTQMLYERENTSNFECRMLYRSHAPTCRIFSPPFQLSTSFANCSSIMVITTEKTRALDESSAKWTTKPSASSSFNNCNNNRLKQVWDHI